MDKLTEMQIQMRQLQGSMDDLSYARVWEDTCRDIDWLQDLPGISPGRWAVGYNYIYVMTRILNELRPRSVLELGLGISTTLISNYFRHHQEDRSEHITIEQDSGWRDFYVKNHQIPDCTDIRIVPVVHREKDGQVFEAYEDLHPIIGGKKFSVISIDGPHGATYFARRDLLPYIPVILPEKFVIVMDDAQRPGEQRTIADLLRKLKAANIEFTIGYYKGSKYCAVITSKNLWQFCSL